jgi:hypothetical protein
MVSNINIVFGIHLDTLIGNSLHNVVANVLISQPVSIISGTQSHFGRVTDLLGAHVLHKTKEKIWADDYIELRSRFS